MGAVMVEKTLDGEKKYLRNLLYENKDMRGFLQHLGVLGKYKCSLRYK